MAATRLIDLIREGLRLDEGVGELSLTTFIEGAERYCARYLNLPDLSGFKDEGGEIEPADLKIAVAFMVQHLYENQGQQTTPNESPIPPVVISFLNMIKEILP